MGLYWDEETPDVDYTLWPEHYRVIELYQLLRPNWLLSEGRKTGINWAVVPGFMTMLNIKRKHWPEFFKQLKLMESTALDCWHGR